MPKTGEHAAHWKGGKVRIGRYSYVYQPNHPAAVMGRYVCEHRFEMERKLGRYLEPEEVVHHVDGDAMNNDPNNLSLMANQSTHLKLHHAKGWTKCRTL